MSFEETLERMSTIKDNITKDSELERLQRRESFIQKYHYYVGENKSLREANAHMQTKISEYFRRKKAENAELASNTSGSMNDQSVDFEQRYNRYITHLIELRKEYQALQISYKDQINELKQFCNLRQTEVDAIQNEFAAFKYNIAKKSLNSRTGRPLNLRDIENLQASEQRKEAAVVEVRLENIKLQNEVNKFESILKSKEELAEGLHLIDFEQLKIENQTYNEKIEERNEELGKLKKKIATTVQIMTHVKEKLQSIQYELVEHRDYLNAVDKELTQHRDKNTRLKQTRDKLRSGNSRLKRSCGLLGRNDLLLNYETCVDAIDNKKKELEMVRQRTLNCLAKTRSIQVKMNKN
ncbi:unnamed protein product [Protopolystoma xenopodis]|uniref:CCDC113/CCDC96 coiled-coil domain-containing protein n=1 Tax=Protopolystoma xenopodis TaxID=117903 RepID=A0A448XDZ7_9PLAT|nr:unnamed protein product [Protopolystoma xenopodis]